MKWIWSYRRKWFWWFRIFDRGLYCKDVRHETLLLSERKGYTRMIKIGPYRIGVLRKLAMRSD